MSLPSGTVIGSYEIVAPLGAGGMGEVYRARDTSLRREVALKILPEAFANDPERLARFEREAHVLASLNHPNIAAIYGIEHRALVMELVEGEELAQRIGRGPVPLGDALSIAAQIALALEAAHEGGVIHRDLKPANIKVKDDGTVKVLDFGLAKALDPGLQQDPASSATMTSPAQTQQGVILGTAAYMSPEQARGRTVDRRADMWAFGVVVFEMLTGRPLFPGETVTDVIASVVTREPDWATLPAGTPASLRRMLRRCLEKDPKRRLRDAADAKLDLEESQLHPGVGDESPTRAGSLGSRRPLWLLVAAAALIALVVGVGGALIFAGPRATDIPFKVLNLTLPEASSASVVISPDGQLVAVISDRKIFVKGMDQSAWRELPGTTGAGIPLIFSPDGRQIAFPLGNSIRKVDLVGSRPQMICDKCIQPNGLRGGSWNADDVLLLGGSPEDARLMSGLFRISTNGGPIERVTTRDTARGEASHRYPSFLPDGRRFVFTVRRDNGEHEIRLGDLAGTPPTTVVSGFSKTAYANGYLLFARDETLLALKLDPATGQASGDPVKVTDRVLQNVGTAHAAFAVSNDGTLVFGPAAETRGFRFFDRHGRTLANVTTRPADPLGRVSPDGRLAAVAEIDPEKSSSDINIIDLATGARSRFTSGPSWEQFPVWSVDQKRLAYRVGRLVFVQPIDGGKPRQVADFGEGSTGYVHDWSPDGTYLLVTRSSVGGGELARLSLADGRIEPIAAGQREEGGHARLTTDGRWVAYVSSETGSNEIHIRGLPDLRVTRRVTTTGGSAPLWSRDGKELFYLDSEGWVVACAVRISGSTIDTGPPERLFKPALGNTWGSGYSHDVDAGGRFFAYRVGDDAGSFANVLTVMLNWTKAIR